MRANIQLAFFLNNNMAESRFVSFSEEEIASFLDSNENRNTARKTKNDLELFKAFLKEKEYDLEPEEIPPETLDNLLKLFVLGMRKQDGSDYEQSSLRCIISSIEIHLRKNNYIYSIIKSVEFAGTREVLKSKQKSLKSCGKGDKPNAARSLTTSEINELYDKNQLGIDNPNAMLNTLWFNNTLHFGMRGGKEHRDLCWGDIELKRDQSVSTLSTQKDRRRREQVKTLAISVQ